MKRRTLDILFSAGGVLFAVLFLVLGLVLQNQADFANGYVAHQLGDQKIVFTPAAALGGADQQPGGDCLVTYATLPMTTGKQAECYANQYIAFHLSEAAKAAGYEGATFATLGSVVRGDLPAAVKAVQDQIDAATAAGQPTADLAVQLKAAQDKLTAISGLRDTMFQGETLRGLLLTSYGFSIFGERAGQAALLCFLGALLLLVLSLAGFVHAFRTPKDELILTGAAKNGGS
jgi:hypothetical protein